MNLPATHRRHFLKASASLVAGAWAGPTLAAQSAATPIRHCIFINLVGGPSQLETFDPKPLAPADVRGPFRPLRTAVPGIFVSELLPRLASRMNQVALVRSVYHHEAPIHETGQQLVQTGRLAEPGAEVPPAGALAVDRRFSPSTAARAALVPGPIRNTGVAISHGQGLASCSPNPFSATSAEVERYGDTFFGRGCLQARQLVEAGCRFITVNAYDTVFHEPTWDCHADGAALATTLEDLRTQVAPAFDRAYSTLLDELAERGLLASTLVIASGEFGRTPRINRRGGRDHAPGVWTALFAGGNVRGGLVLGASDAHAAEPAEHAVHASCLAATAHWALGGDVAGWKSAYGIAPEARPLVELF